MSSAIQLHELPTVLINLIYDYIPKTVTVFLSKAHYTVGHPHIRSFINKRQIEDYIRTMVLQNNDFVIQHLLI